MGETPARGRQDNAKAVVGQKRVKGSQKSGQKRQENAKCATNAVAGTHTHKTKTKVNKVPTMDGRESSQILSSFCRNYKPLRRAKSFSSWPPTAFQKSPC